MSDTVNLLPVKEEGLFSLKQGRDQEALPSPIESSYQHFLFRLHIVMCMHQVDSHNQVKKHIHTHTHTHTHTQKERDREPWVSV